MKAIAILDIDDELLEEYEDFEIECNLIATSKEDPLWRDCVRFVGEAELKPLPEKREVKTDFIGVGDYDFDDIYNAGFNSCIDEILGESE